MNVTRGTQHLLSRRKSTAADHAEPRDNEVEQAMKKGNHQNSYSDFRNSSDSRISLLLEILVIYFAVNTLADDIKGKAST